MDGSTGEDLAWLKLMEMTTLVCLPMAIKAAINLNVFDILMDQQRQPGSVAKQLTAAQIISRIDKSNARTRSPSFDAQQSADTLDRILRLLASHSLLSCSVSASELNNVLQPASDIRPQANSYGPTPICKYLVRNNISPYFLFLTDPLVMDARQHVAEAVLEGAEPFSVAHGTDFFTYTKTDSRCMDLYNCAMASVSKLHIAALLRSYSGFEGISSFVDVGGGIGMTSSMILHKYPHIKAINFDRPDVIETTYPYPGLQHVAGDMFVEVPQAEVCLLKSILHDWDYEHCIMILKKCFEAIPSHGKVIIVDVVQPNQVETSLVARVGYQMDVEMMVGCQGGKEHTEAELKALATSAGFRKGKVMCSFSELSVMELHKL